MKSIFRKEFIIGLTVIIALAILFFGINFLKGINLFKASNYYFVTFENVDGLAQSAPVTLNGYKVGIVRNIDYDFNNPGHVTVEISLDKGLKLNNGSEAVLSSDILGTASITLNLTQNDTQYKIGDTIPGKVNGGMMADISNRIMPSVGAILPKIDSLLSNLNALTANPALHASVTRLDDITLQLDASMRSLKNVMATLQPISSNIQNITQNVDTITGDLAQVSSRLRDVPVDSIATDIQITMTNLRKLSDSLNDPNTSVGKLTTNPELYDNINATIQSLDSLFVDIKQNPKRYINVKVF